MARSIATEFLAGFKLILKSKYFYVSLLILLLGAIVNFLSQIYLYSFVSNGNTLPVLSDIILDSIPYLNLTLVYNFFSFTSLIIFFAYIIDKKKYNEIPFFIIVLGLFYTLRGIFVILTPFGNPEEFIGLAKIFPGLSKFQFGLYPSGHTGSVFLYFLFAKGTYRGVLGLWGLLIVLGLFFSRGHYSIDVLSAIIFSYALYCFGKDYLRSFIIKFDS